MILLREIVAVILFAAACGGIVDLFESGFAWSTFGLIFLLFWLAWWVWPSKRKGQRDDENSFLDILELVIELPFELLIWFFRLFGRLFKDGDVGIDL